MTDESEYIVTVSLENTTTEVLTQESITTRGTLASILRQLGNNLDGMNEHPGRVKINEVTIVRED